VISYRIMDGGGSVYISTGGEGKVVPSGEGELVESSVEDIPGEPYVE